jgi:hypothetical protein
MGRSVDAAFTPSVVRAHAGKFSPAASTGRLKFVQLFCWAQVMMVVANLGRIPVLTTEEREFPLAFNELCLGIMLIGAALSIRSWKSLFVDRIAVTALVFAGIGAASAIWSISRFGLGPFELFVSLAFLARWMSYFALYVALINVLTTENVESAWRAIETMLVLMALFGMVQAAFLPNFAQMVAARGSDWDEQGHRLISTVLEPNIAGVMLMIGLLVQMARISVGASVRWWRVLVLSAALALTLSRSAVVGMFFGLLVILLAAGLSRRLVRAMIAAWVIVALVSPFLVRFLMSYGKFSVGEGTSAGARVLVWVQTLHMVGEHPVFGIGFNTYRYALEYYGFGVIGPSSYGAEGGLLFVLALTGVVGLAVYCTMMGQVAALSRSIWRDLAIPAEHRAIAIGTAASTLGVVIASIFVNAMLATFVMEILWVLWALTFVIARRQRARKASAVSKSPHQLAGFAF